MRVLIIGVILATTGASGALAQGRVVVGPVVRVDQVYVEGGASGSTAVAGLGASVTLSRLFALDGEITWATNPIERSYEGRFISYADGPNASREEIERLAPVARRSLGYEPGLGWAAAFVMRGAVAPHVSLAARIGVSARRYLETSSYPMISVPAGSDPARVARDFQSSSNHKTRGGLLAGVSVPIAVTSRFTVAPELRFVYGGPAQVGNKHREIGFGVRAGWGL